MATAGKIDIFKQKDGLLHIRIVAVGEASEPWQNHCKPDWN